MEKIIVSPERLLVKHQTKEKVTSSGIILPKVDDTKETPQIVEVISVGTTSEERLVYDFDIKEKEIVGKQIIIPKYAGVTIEVDTEEMKVIEYSDVLAIIND